MTSDTTNKDIWSMEYTKDEDKLSFTGKTPKSITELLIGVKQYMETKKNELCKSAQEPTVS